jgi:EAL and modified HD-GYP domain-containing signal transduction protein
MALERARFCELVAQHMKLPTADFFLTGLFSLLDAILNRPLAQIVEQIPISAPCRDALTGVPNQQKRTLDFAAASARGRWEDLPQFCDQVGCTELEACQWQFEAQRWVHAVLAKEPK